MHFTEYLFIVLFFGIPGVLGAYMARTRGKNPLVWGLVSAPFPFAVFILWYQKPKKEVPGYFRHCNHCGEVYPWKNTHCKYCNTPP